MLASHLELLTTCLTVPGCSSSVQCRLRVLCSCTPSSCDAIRHMQLLDQLTLHDDLLSQAGRQQRDL